MSASEEASSMDAQTSSILWTSASRSHPGRVRQVNEDSCLEQSEHGVSRRAPHVAAARTSAPAPPPRPAPPPTAPAAATSPAPPAAAAPPVTAPARAGHPITIEKDNPYGT